MNKPVTTFWLLVSPALVSGHGALYMPTPRNAMDRHLSEFEGGKSPIESCTCNNGNGGAKGPIDGCDMGLRGGVDGKGDGQSCLWWSQACSIGCDKCATETAGTTPLTGNPPNAGKIGFRKRYCNSTLKATLPRHAWTLNMDVEEGAEEDSYRFNPWRAPGYAPVVNPCGQAGGEFAYQKLGGESVYYNTTNAVKGMLGSELPPTPAELRPKWKVGSSVEVQWGVRYNHGGGYAYRLCPSSEPLTEECFQRHHLDFDTTKQVLKWDNGSLQYAMEDKAVFVGGNLTAPGSTFPSGSMWARNPIPRIWDSKCPWDTYLTKGLAPCTPPKVVVANQGVRRAAHGSRSTTTFSCTPALRTCSSDWVVGVVSDEVIIPEGLAPGEYVLSWRWDCEETAQIWQNCADVTVVG